MRIVVGGTAEDDAAAFLDALERIDRGEHVHERVLSFQGWKALASAMTGARQRLLRHLHAHSGPSRGEAPLSAAIADRPGRLDLAELVARVERSQEETRRFVAEQHELMAERSKLLAEGATLQVSRFVTPTAAVVAALGALTAATPVLARWFGRGG